MKLSNHYKTAEIIYRRIKRKGMGLKRFPFVLGSLAPDLCLSFIFRRHEYACSALSVKKILFHLYEGRLNPRSALFAYFMGMAGHYVCDYFCYSHSPAFRGSLRDHIKYEWLQRVPSPKAISFFGREDQTLGFYPLMDILDECIRGHDHDLARDAATAETDIALGAAVAEWLTGAVFSSAERFFPEPVPVSLAGETLITG